MIRKLLLLAAATSTLLVTSCLTSPSHGDASHYSESAQPSDSPPAVADTLDSGRSTASEQAATGGTGSEQVGDTEDTSAERSLETPPEKPTDTIDEAPDRETLALSAESTETDVGDRELLDAESTDTSSTLDEPADREPTGSERTGSERTGSERTGSERTGSERTGSERTGGEATGGDPTGSEPTGSERTGGERTGGEPTGGEPTGGEPTGSDPTNGEPADALPEVGAQQNPENGNRSHGTIVAAADHHESRRGSDPPMDNESLGRIANHLVASDLETQVGQLLMVQFRTGRDGRPITSVTDEVRQILDSVRPGGVILFAENIVTVEQTATFIRDLQNASDVPLFVSVDEEGGFVSRLNRSGLMGATAVPSAERIGRTANPDFAREAGRIIGTELNALGINMNMAPVADVNTNPTNGIIAHYERAFGSNPEFVAQMVAAMVEGLQDSGVSAVLKHFPGHGDTEQDTHTGSVVSDSSLERLRTVELVPFRTGIDSGVDGVMTAHIAYPSITGTFVPATFSERLLTGLLRRELGFDGLIISDALEMGAVLNSQLSEDPVVAAVAAGVDLVLSPRDPIEAHSALVSAVRDGTLEPGRVRDAVERVLRVKNRRGIFDDPELSTEERTRRAKEVLGNPEHLKLIEELLSSEVTGSSHTSPNSTIE